jgi:hypothetical protein
MIKKLSDNIGIFLLASLTLGLAPFSPEPHVWGKIKWVLGGANGMQAMDWFDLLLHGLPWVLLILSAAARLRLQFTK